MYTVYQAVYWSAVYLLHSDCDKEMETYVGNLCFHMVCLSCEVCKKIVRRRIPSSMKIWWAIKAAKGPFLVDELLWLKMWNQQRDQDFRVNEHKRDCPLQSVCCYWLCYFFWKLCQVSSHTGDWNKFMAVWSSVVCRFTGDITHNLMLCTVIC